MNILVNVKVILRHFLVDKLFLAINVLGFAIAISVSWVIFQYVSYELRFDSEVQSRDRIYRVVTKVSFDGKESGNTGIPSALYIHSGSLPGISFVVPVFSKWTRKVLIDNVDLDGAPICFTTAQYFDLLPFKWLAGNPNKALDKPGQVVLTSDRASFYFPGLHPSEILGRTILYDDTINVLVTGIVSKLEFPTTFGGQEFRSIDAYGQLNWNGVNSNQQIYLVLDEKANKEIIIEEINRISFDNGGKDLAQYKMSRHHELQKLEDIHFNKFYVGGERTISKGILFTLSCISGFILILACINYANLATARLPKRLREIGIRKTLGSSQIGILFFFLCETILVVLISMVLSFVMVVCLISFFYHYFPGEFLNYIRIDYSFLFLGFLVLVVTLLSGIYPGIIIMKSSPVKVLRGRLGNILIPGGSKVRKVLIAFQFCVAAFFLVCSFIVNQQLRYLLHNDLGFSRNGVLLVSMSPKINFEPSSRERFFLYSQALSQINGIENIAIGVPPFSESYNSNSYTYSSPDGTQTTVNMFRKAIEPEMIEFYDLKIIAGTNLPKSDTLAGYLMNETAVSALGLGSSQEAIGITLKESNRKEFPVVGVVADFHTRPFTEKIDPLILYTSKSSLNTLNIRLASRNPSYWVETLNKADSLWRVFFYNEPFTYTFYDDVVNKAYTTETNLETYSGIATGISLLIGCIGIFGLSHFLIQRREKEIGIRKVFGASVFEIVLKLNIECLSLSVVAFIIATPFAWVAANKWLSSYAYHIKLSWWIFAIPGFVLMLIAVFTTIIQCIKSATKIPIIAIKNE